MASRNCGCRKATVYLQIGCGQATETALPRRYSICGKQSADEYTQKPARCKLVCNSNGFSQMCVLQGTLISPNRYGQATGSAMPRRYSICGKQSAAEYTKKTAQCKLVCTSNGFSQMCVLQGTLISPNKIRQATWSALPRRYSICGKHCAAEYTRTFRHLNRDKTRKIHCNSLRNFLLHGFNKHISWFRCSGKGKHLNPA